MNYITGIGFLKVKEMGPKPPEGSDVWWSAQDKRYANYDPFAEFEQPSGSHIVIELTPYIVEKYTPKGVWLSGSFGEKFFVLGRSVKQAAVPTKELALKDLIARKEKHVEMARKRMDAAHEALSMSQAALAKEVREDLCGD